MKRPCYVLRQACPDGADVEIAARCAEDLLADDKAVYVRVARREQWADCAAEEAVRRRLAQPVRSRELAATRRARTILVQYWYFYPYNEWVAPVAIGELEQIHPADWEAVTVGFSARAAAVGRLLGPLRRDASPTGARIRVAKLRSRRGCGPWSPSPTAPRPTTASPRRAASRTSPSATGIARDRLALASYAANIRDRTDDQRPGARPRRPADRHRRDAADDLPRPLGALQPHALEQPAQGRCASARTATARRRRRCRRCGRRRWDGFSAAVPGRRADAQRCNDPVITSRVGQLHTDADESKEFVHVREILRIR